MRSDENLKLENDLIAAQDRGINDTLDQNDAMVSAWRFWADFIF